MYTILGISLCFILFVGHWQAPGKYSWKAPMLIGGFGGYEPKGFSVVS